MVFSFLGVFQQGLKKEFAAGLEKVKGLNHL
jgi:hypothetical protein